MEEDLNQSHSTETAEMGTLGMDEIFPKIVESRKKSLNETPSPPPWRNMSSGTIKHAESPGDSPKSSNSGGDSQKMMDEGWKALRRSFSCYDGPSVRNIASLDSAAQAACYDKVFVKDSFPIGLTFLMNGEHKIVKELLLKTLYHFKLDEGVLMPASLKVVHDTAKQRDTIVAAFGDSAIGRAAPVDSGFWWILLLRAYTKATKDKSLAESLECQNGMKHTLKLFLKEGFGTFPGSPSADRSISTSQKVDIYGNFIDTYVVCFMALRCAVELLKQNKKGRKLAERSANRLCLFSDYIKKIFWLDVSKLKGIYHHQTEGDSETAVSKFNVTLDSLSKWLSDFIPTLGGYFVGNVSPSRKDFRWFCLGNCLAIVSSLASPEQSTAIMALIEEHWSDFVGEMPLKVVYPAIEGPEWRIVTGCDPKNTRWSYHNGGSWPEFLWLIAVACIKAERPDLARRALDFVESRMREEINDQEKATVQQYTGGNVSASYLLVKLIINDRSLLNMFLNMLSFDSALIYQKKSSMFASEGHDLRDMPLVLK